MKKPFIKAFDELKKLGVPVFENSDHQARGNFAISAEHPESFKFCDYYSENPAWNFGVSPKLEAVLRKHGLYAEWRDPGSLNVYPA
jgi:hypothetical protein